MRSAALSGSRGMLIDAAVPTLDPSLKAFKPALLARFAVECAREIRSLASLGGASEASSADVGRIIVMVPGLSCAVEANTLASEGEEEKEWRRSQAEAGRTEASGVIEVISLGMTVPPSPDEPPPAAVVVVGLLPPADADDNTVSIAREWLRLASGFGPADVGATAIDTPAAAGTSRPPPLMLGINLRSGVLREVHDFVTICALVPYSIVRRGRAGAASEDWSDVEEAKVLLYRVHPQPFRVLVAPPGGDGAAATYHEVVALPQRPDMERIGNLVESQVDKMRAQREEEKTSRGESVRNGATVDSCASGINAGGTSDNQADDVLAMDEAARRAAAQRALSTVFTSMTWDAPEASTNDDVSSPSSGVPANAATPPPSSDLSADKKSTAEPAKLAATAAAAAEAAELSVFSWSYTQLDDEMKLYASASALRMSHLGEEVAVFNGDANVQHIIARPLPGSRDLAPARLAALPAAATALLRICDTGGGHDDATLEQLAVADGEGAQRGARALAVILCAASAAAEAGCARLVAPAAVHSEDHAAEWFSSAGMVEENEAWVLYLNQ
uniref:Uncharacterized protein n=1 Tax=Strombidinopsis acuminata TaxID=141414 RepID=A0A7S3RCX9_9SPIT